MTMSNYFTFLQVVILALGWVSFAQAQEQYLTTADTINQDEQNDEGVELEASWNISPALSVSGNCIYLDGQVTTQGSNEQDSSFFNLIRRPRHQVQLNVQIEPLKNVFLNLQLQHLGERDDLFLDAVTFQ